MMRVFIQINLFCALVLAGLCAIPESAYADGIIHEESGLEFWLPDTWEHELNEDLLVIQDPDAQLKLFFLATTLQVLDQGSDAAREEISRIINQPEITFVAEKQEVNGLLQYSAEGFGLYGEEIVNWHLLFVAGARKSLMIIALGDVESNRDLLEDIFRTIQITQSDPDG